MTDTFKLLAFIGLGAAGGYWYCSSRTKKNPDEEMEALLNGRLQQLESGSQHQETRHQETRINPGRYDENDASLRIRQLENSLERLHRERALERRARSERRFDLDEDLD